MPKVHAIWKGLDNIDKNLDVLVDKIERGVMRDAMMKAATPLLKQSRTEARKVQQTGALRRSLKKKTVTDKRTGEVKVFIGPDRKFVTGDYAGKHTPAHIAHLVEFGFNHKSGKRVAGKNFLRNAFDSKKGEAIATYKRELGPNIEKIAKRTMKRARI